MMDSSKMKDGICGSRFFLPGGIKNGERIKGIQRLHGLFDFAEYIFILDNGNEHKKTYNMLMKRQEI
jgi:hypothetical protein